MNPEARRLFLREPGWQIGQKTDSRREFCFATAPGEDHYHRLQLGEVFVAYGDERLCIPCAERRGLIEHEPRTLRDPMDPITIDADDATSTFDLRPPEAGADL